ncbi:hypothetical protein BDY24DRAFT_54508 [Mrakia frigida]|uniref:uncharacterized protein n=1 Tax=Mrakia frigida TaxID=29902 RepID=UPI003FCC036D
MSLPPVPYSSIISTLIETYSSSLASQAIAAPSPLSSASPASEELNFSSPPSPDCLVEGSFLPGTFISKLESDETGGEGLYNVVLDPKPRTPYSFVLATKDFHPQSDPIRAPFLVHSYRLLLLLETAVRKNGKGNEKVVASYDCGEKAGGVEAHKNVRLFVIPDEDLKTPDLPNTITQSLPSSLSIETPTQELSSVFAKLLVDFMPKEGSYNLIFTARQFFVVPRSDETGDLGKGEGKVDGGRLLGVL